MGKKTDRLIFALARFGLIIALAVCLISAVAAILTVSFNVPGRIRLNKNTWLIVSEFDRGIPFYAALNADIPDSSILRRSGGATSWRNYYPGDDTPAEISSDSIDYSDKIFSDFNVMNVRAESQDIKLSGAKLNTVVFYLQPRKFWDRLLLSLPGILTLLLVAFCSWQLLRIIAAIRSGSSFNESSAKRIAAIGWAIVFTVLLFFIVDAVQTNVVAISMNFTSTIPNYRMPFQATAYKEGFSHLDWLIGGAIILLISKAFSYGNQLQKYEDQTI